LFLAFDVDLPYFILMGTITTTYFIASSLPTFQFFDFAVKGGVAVYFFGLLGINEWIVVFISMLMWFLNIVLPVLIGSIYVFRFEPQLQKTEII
jgi:ABC-type bacteriocin/lantibiotic exporter with double-glycine peptidase domain